MRSASVRFGGILADAGYGLSGPFRQALTERGLTWAVGIPYKQEVYPADVAMIFPVAGRGRPRKNYVPDVASRPAQEVLESAKWQTVSWRRGTKGKLSARFAAMRVRVADGPPQRIGDLGQQHLPGEEVWLVGEHRSTGERKYYLSNLPVDTPLRKLAGAIKARWVCEQAHQQLKEELGLDHFEGRSWQGLHRHTLMSMIAFAFLQARRLKAAGYRTGLIGKLQAGNQAPGAEALDRVWQLWSPNKALGLTGVRGAYAIAPLQGLALARSLEQMAPSWPLGAHAVAMLTAWVQADAQRWLAQSREQLTTWKAAQVACLGEAGWVCLPSEANYVCARAPHALDVPALRAQGIKLRDTTSLGLPGHWRLGVLPPAAQQALHTAVLETTKETSP